MVQKKDRNYSHTMLGNWRRCRFRFYLAYELGLEGPPSIGQAKGTAGHRAIAAWHTGSNREEVLAVATESLWEEGNKAGFPEEQIDKAWTEDLEPALGRYMDWSDNRDFFTVEDIERKFEIIVAGETFVGYIDAIITDQHGQTWLMENKFNKQVSTKHLELDPQVSIYLIAARLIGYEPSGVMYNIIRMSNGPTAQREPVVRVPVYRNPEGLSAVAKELERQVIEIRAFLNGEGEVYRNPTHDCHWDCPFYTICLAINDAGEAEDMIETWPRRK